MGVESRPWGSRQRTVPNNRDWQEKGRFWKEKGVKLRVKLKQTSANDWLQEKTNKLSRLFPLSLVSSVLPNPFKIKQRRQRQATKMSVSSPSSVSIFAMTALQPPTKKVRPTSGAQGFVTVRGWMEKRSPLYPNPTVLNGNQPHSRLFRKQVWSASIQIGYALLITY